MIMVTRTASAATAGAAMTPARTQAPIAPAASHRCAAVVNFAIVVLHTPSVRPADRVRAHSTGSQGRATCDSTPFDNAPPGSDSPAADRAPLAARGDFRRMEPA